MNPLRTDVSTVTITSPLHSFIRELFARRRRVNSHPEAVPERQLNIPRRVDDPAIPTRVAIDLLQRRRGMSSSLSTWTTGIASFATPFS
jgi:hypothetical protein